MKAAVVRAMIHEKIRLTGEYDTEEEKKKKTLLKSYAYIPFTRYVNLFYSSMILGAASGHFLSASVTDESDSTLLVQFL